jgi:serine/threonine-protein kinase
VRFGGNGSDIVVTPDGRRIAYLAGESEARLYLRPLDQLNPTILAPNISNPVGIFVSPDGQWIGFTDPADSSLKKVAVTGGPPLPLAKLQQNIGLHGATWLPDDSIVFGTTNTGLMRVAPGGEPAPITKADPAKGEVAHRYPHALPGGDALLFTIFTADGQSDSMQIALLDLQTGQHQVIVRGGSSPLYSPSGHIVYGNSGTLRAAPFDLKRRAIRANPVGVIEGVVTKAGGAVSAHMAADGSLVYVAGTASTARRSLVWVDRQGREEEIKVPPRTYAYARLSPDGRRIALDIRDEQSDVWTWDLARSTLTRLTFNPGLDRGPIWTADGTRLAVSTATAGAEAVFVQPADGSGTPTRVTPEKGVYFPLAFSPDGKYLLVHNSTTPPYDILMIDVEAKTEPKPLLNAAYSESNAVVSPDGRWIAYQSNESGKDEIYVRPFPNVNEGRWQVSTNGGTRPLWSRDGRELFYFIPPGVIMAAPIVPGSVFSAGTPVAVVKGNYSSPQSGRMYDVSPDGRRFLLIKEVRPQGEAAAPPPQLIVVQHWSEELKRLVP